MMDGLITFDAVDCACLCIWLAWWGSWLAFGMNARRTVARESFRRRLRHLLPLSIGAGLVFSPLVMSPLLTLGLSDSARWLALVGIVAGFALAIWARVHLGRNWSGLVAIKQDHELIASGPYRFVRHPIYCGLSLAMLATAIAIGTLGALFGWAILVAAFVIKSRHEERFLSKAFGVQYGRLCSDVPDRMIPTVY